MQRHLRRALITLAGMTASAGAWAAVTVTYIDSEKMTDVPRFATERSAMEIEFREHLEQLGAKLPPEQNLAIEILDIDLAGDVFPKVAIRDVRVMKGMADWPRIKLRYRLEQNGQLLRSGEQELADPNYQMSINSYRNEMYGYEKQMLDDWFKKDLLVTK
ncbi:MAG: DUF3016 domain-containing protein [Duganella sp.]